MDEKRLGQLGRHSVIGCIILFAMVMAVVMRTVETKTVHDGVTSFVLSGGEWAVPLFGLYLFNSLIHFRWKKEWGSADYDMLLWNRHTGPYAKDIDGAMTGMTIIGTLPGLLLCAMWKNKSLPR